MADYSKNDKALLREHSLNEKVSIFINEKVAQLSHYITAAINHTIDHSELDIFIDNTMAEWTLLPVQDETPHNDKENVFWYVMFELQFHNAKTVLSDPILKQDLDNCLQFFKGRYKAPSHCVSWRPIP